MKILQITAGTGNYHCDTCLRDHALVRALRADGHDVLLTPLYLPLVTEVPDTDDLPIFMGGVNAYLQQKFALFRHTPGWIDGLFNTRWMLKTASRLGDMTQPADLGQLTVSTLMGMDGRQRKELIKLCDWLQVHYPNPDVVILSNAMLLGLARPLRQSLRAPVLCTLQGSDYFVEGLPEPWRGEAWGLMRQMVDDVSGLIAVSQFYGDLMSRHMRIPPAKLHVVRNGIDLSGFESLERQDAGLVIGYFSQMTPLKGLQELVDAFIHIYQRGKVPGVRLKVGGSIAPAMRGFVERLRKQLTQAGLSGQFSIEEILERPAKQAFLASCSVYSVPVQVNEPSGLYMVDAMAAGTPVVAPRRGALPELVELTGGGVCYPPDEPLSLVEALESLLLDESDRQAMGAAGRAAAHQHFSAQRMAADIVQVIESTRT